MANNIQQRRTSLFNKVTQSISADMFERASQQTDDGDFLGFITYQEFVNYQWTFINRLDAGQLDTFTFLTNIEPYLAILDEESSIVTPTDGFAINSEGQIVLIMPR